MDNLTRSELKMILDGLQRVREERRQELLDDGEQNLMGCDEYSSIVMLQEKVLRVLERMPY
jgi:hypothetical protein